MKKSALGFLVFAVLLFHSCGTTETHPSSPVSYEWAGKSVSPPPLHRGTAFNSTSTEGPYSTQSLCVRRSVRTDAIKNHVTRIARNFAAH
ncbi:hypothetical protein L2E82_33695 [Cichorium intybus]|uniref:Uncharacterized protein n=1 Tax=Cichorium intybus TaxID=13427 RepID=A0ACB9BKV2_CICIN|nr:hypothetical protein L2E82_33695 [Cichorium intybus]